MSANTPPLSLPPLSYLALPACRPIAQYIADLTVDTPGPAYAQLHCHDPGHRQLGESTAETARWLREGAGPARCRPRTATPVAGSHPSESRAQRSQSRGSRRRSKDTVNSRPSLPERCPSWPKERDWKSRRRCQAVSWVRIPPSPLYLCLQVKRERSGGKERGYELARDLVRCQAYCNPAAWTSSRALVRWSCRSRRT